MGQRLAHRPARVGPVATPSRPLDVVAPPAVAESAAGAAGAMQVMLPILGGGGSLVMILANRNALMLIAGAIMLGVTVVGGVVPSPCNAVGPASEPPAPAFATSTISTASAPNSTSTRKNSERSPTPAIPRRVPYRP